MARARHTAALAAASAVGLLMAPAGLMSAFTGVGAVRPVEGARPVQGAKRAQSRPGLDAQRTSGSTAAMAGLVSVAVAAATAAARRLRRAGSSGRVLAVGRAAGELPPMRDVGVVLLSAGVGKRMGAGIPKQYIKLLNLEIALHSLNVFLQCDVAAIVIVCAEEWRKDIFQAHLDKQPSVKPAIKFADGGAERQDSVRNGLALIENEFVAVHDAARPLVTAAEVAKVVADARAHGAALLAVQTKATIKQATGFKDKAVVSSTPDRKMLWEAHTPQVIRSALLRRGFENAERNNLAVTDDVSLVEFLNEPVKLTEGEYTNIKVTTPEDLAVAEAILRSRGYTG